MGVTRIYYAGDLKKEGALTLDTRASHHLLRVLRSKINEPVIIFNGEGGEYTATLVKIDKKIAVLDIHTFQDPQTESPLHIELGQGISRSERMDYAIQKSVELGVNVITPLITERCNIKLNDRRLQNRLKHWKGIIISACEQSGRCTIPKCRPPQLLTEWLQTPRTGHAFVGEPGTKQRLTDIKNAEKNVTLCIGPEGGLTTAEIQAAKQANFSSLSLGPRTLRTETAAVVAMSLLQCSFGDV